MPREDWIPLGQVSVVMMRRVFELVGRTGTEDEKTDLGIRSVIAFESDWFEARRGLAHPGFRPIHRDRSRSGWQNPGSRRDSFLMRFRL